MRIAVLLIATVLLSVVSVEAIPVEYSITLTGSAFARVVLGPDDFFPPTGFGRLEPGRQYVGLGSFTVDDELLARSGVNLIGHMTAWTLRFEDFDASLPNAMLLIRGPCDNSPLPLMCLAPAPGFAVENGEIVGLSGGVARQSDIPYIDFTPGCCGYPGGFFHGADQVFDVYGSISIARTSASEDIIAVPLPATLLLLLGGVALATTLRRRRASAR